MSDFTVTINPPETTSITIGGGIAPHNSTHAPSGSDSLERWYATTDSLAYVSGQIGSPAGVVLVTGNQEIAGVKNFSSRPTVNGSGVMLTGESSSAGTGYLTGYVAKTETGTFVSSGNTGNFVTSNQTGQLTGTFYPYSANPAAYVQGSVVRPSNTGNFVDRGSTQTISGQKNFTIRPQVSGVGVQTTGEYTEFNLWDEFSGALYPYPKNDLNRTWNTIKRMENLAGTSGDTIWLQFPTWTGAVPSGTNITEYYNTGFWARQYDFSCVAFKNSRSGYPIATLVTPRHVLASKHSNPVSGTKYVFFSNTETGYAWEATVSSVTQLSGDCTISTLSADVPSQIRPASVIGSQPSAWALHSLLGTRELCVKNSRVFSDYIGSISTGNAPPIQQGSLIISHLQDPTARFTDLFEGGDSNSPQFIPLQNGKLVYIGGASTVTSSAFVGDPVLRSGIIAATSGYTLDVWDAPIQSTALLPVSGQFKSIGTSSNRWDSIDVDTVNANRLVGDLFESYVGQSTELLYGGEFVVDSTLNGFTFLTEQVEDLNSFIFSGSFPETFSSRFIISNNASVTFTGVSPVSLVMPNGSGFSGSGYVIEARAVDSNKILIQPISVPNSVYGGSTGYLTGYTPIGDSITGIAVNGSSTKTITLYQQDGSTLSASFTDQQGTGGAGEDLYIYSGSFDTGNGNLTLNRTGDNGTVTIPLDGRYVTGTVVRQSETGSFLTSGQTGNFITTSQTGAFYPSNNPSGFVTGVDLSPYATTVLTTGISGYLQTQITNNNQTGSFLTTGAADSRYASQSATGAYTGAFYPRFSNPSGYITGVDLSPYATVIFVTGISGYQSGLIANLQSATGDLNTRVSSVENVTGSFALSSNTGAFLTTGAADSRYALQSATGAYTGAFYPRSSNPSNYLIAADLSTYATQTYVTGASGYLQGQINVLNGQTGTYITGSVVRQSETGNFVTSSQTGNFVSTSQTGSFATTGYVTGVSGYLSSLITSNSAGVTSLNNATGAISITGAGTSSVSADGQIITVSGSTGHLSSYALTGQTGAFLTTGAADSRYARIPRVSEIYIDAGAMLTGVSGATPTTTTVGLAAYDAYTFNDATTGFTQFKVSLADYNLGDIKVKFNWTANATGSIVWGVQSVAIGNGDSMNLATWGTATEITDTYITGSGLHSTDATTSFTPSGSPQSGDNLFFRVYRNVSSASDTLSGNSSLLGLSIQYTGNLIAAW